MQTIPNYDTLGSETIDMADLEADLFGFVPENFVRDLTTRVLEPGSGNSRVPTATDRSRYRS